MSAIQEEKKTRHKWNDGRKKFSVCERCGCEKFRGVYIIQYKLNGVASTKAPECKPTQNP